MSRGGLLGGEVPHLHKDTLAEVHGFWVEPPFNLALTVFPHQRTVSVALPDTHSAHKLSKKKRPQGLRRASKSWANCADPYHVLTPSSMVRDPLGLFFQSCLLCHLVIFPFPGSLAQPIEDVHIQSPWMDCHGAACTEGQFCAFWSSWRSQKCSSAPGLCKQMFWQLTTASCDSFPENHWTVGPRRLLKRQALQSAVALFTSHENAFTTTVRSLDCNKEFQFPTIFWNVKITFLCS